MEVVVAVLFAIILVYLALLMQALLPQPPAPNMSVPVQESLDDFDVFADYPSNLNQLVVQPNTLLIVPCQNGNLIHSFFLLFISSSYVTLHLQVYIEQMPEDISVEPIQCTNTGDGVFVIGGKDYPPQLTDNVNKHYSW